MRTKKATKKNAKHDDVFLCPNCVQPVDPSENFCPQCNTPVGTMTTIDPFMRMRTYQYLMFRVTSRNRLAGVLLSAGYIMIPLVHLFFFQAINRDASLVQRLYGPLRLFLIGAAISGGIALTVFISRKLPH